MEKKTKKLELNIQVDEQKISLKIEPELTLSNFRKQFPQYIKINDFLLCKGKKLNNENDKIFNLITKNDILEIKKVKNLKKSNSSRNLLQENELFNRSILINPDYIEKKNYKLFLHPEIKFSEKEKNLCHTILLIGETGSGKTTFINFLVNAIFKIEFSDDKRLILINEKTNKSESESQTSDVNEYNIKTKDYPPLKIVDTPGFSDTKGIYADFENTKKIINYLIYKCKKLNAICFVIKKGDFRNTPTRKYIFNSIIDLFTYEIITKIIFIITNDDPNCQNDNQIIKSISEELAQINKNLTKINYFRFSNTKELLKKKNNKLKNQWDYSMKNYQNFLKKIYDMEPLNLYKTKEYLFIKQKIDIFSKSYVSQQKILNDKEERQKNIEKQIDEEKSKKEEYKDYQINEKTKSQRLKKLKDGEYVDFCIKCKKVCHDNCNIENNNEKYKCPNFKINGLCEKCNHSWEDHKNTQTIVVEEEKTIEFTLEDVKKKCEECEKKIEEYENEKKKIEEDIDNLKDNLKEIKEQIYYSIKYAQKIRINKKTSKSYIDYLDERIKTFQNTKPQNWSEMVKKYIENKDRIELIKKIENEIEDEEKGNKKKSNYLKKSYQYIKRKLLRVKNINNNINEIIDNNEIISNLLNLEFTEEEKEISKTLFFFSLNKNMKEIIIYNIISSLVKISDFENDLLFQNEKLYVRGYKIEEYFQIFFPNIVNDGNLSKVCFKIFEKIKDFSNKLTYICIIFEKNNNDFFEKFLDQFEKLDLLDLNEHILFLTFDNYKFNNEKDFLEKKIFYLMLGTYSKQKILKEYKNIDKDNKISYYSIIPEMLNKISKKENIDSKDLFVQIMRRISILNTHKNDFIK